MFSEPHDPPESQRRGIHSVEIGMAVLQSVVDFGRAASLKEIAASTGLESSQTHRYVSSLVKVGMLVQNEAGRYDLGYTALRTGLAALSRHEPLVRANVTAREFANETKATTLLAVWSINGPVILGWHPGRPPVYMTLGVGSTLPVTSSATGKVFMAFLPDQYIEPFLKTEGWRVPLNKNKPLVHNINEIRDTCMAYVDSSVIPGLRASAAPIFGPDNMVVAVVAAIASELVPRERDESVDNALIAACKQASFELGAEKYGTEPLAAS